MGVSGRGDQAPQGGRGTEANTGQDMSTHMLRAGTLPSSCARLPTPWRPGLRFTQEAGRLPRKTHPAREEGPTALDKVLRDAQPVLPAGTFRNDKSSQFSELPAALGSVLLQHGQTARVCQTSGEHSNMRDKDQNGQTPSKRKATWKKETSCRE